MNTSTDHEYAARVDAWGAWLRDRLPHRGEGDPVTEETTVSVECTLGDAEATVEVTVRSGLPLFTIMGAPDRTIREAREIVKGALRNQRYEYPEMQILVDVVRPAAMRYRLNPVELAWPIARGILASTGQAPAPAGRLVRAGLRVTGDLCNPDRCTEISGHTLRLMCVLDGPKADDDLQRRRAAEVAVSAGEGEI